ncbi:MAG: N-acetylneuraminate synthase [Lachnospiraceae bacterium]|jgi:N-acetylneuraminate synthase|nr:N-acetylneuraminate synthase [Lachnospiraceae bacterium]
MGVYIIAEAGVNHNGDIDIALQMIDKAKECGVDCIKFQTFKTEKLVTKDAKKAEYQVLNTENADSQFSMLKALELSFEDFKILKEHCDEVGIDFMSTPFDMESVDVLEKLGVKEYKMSSGDITNKQLLEYVASKNKPMIISTGMCDMDEVKEAVGWIENMGNKDITLLHCTSNYPAPYEEVNMLSMLTLKNAFPYPVGYSDHTKGVIIPITAVAMGAKVIEKHFTLDKNMKGPDHKASLDVAELKDMVDAIRIVEVSKGDGIKAPAKSELSTRSVARKSIVAKAAKRKGDVLTSDDITIKRPGDGIPPKYMDEIIGKELVRDIAQDELLQFEDLK